MYCRGLLGTPEPVQRAGALAASGGRQMAPSRREDRDTALESLNA
jgi:hypothetical protein